MPRGGMFQRITCHFDERCLRGPWHRPAGVAGQVEISQCRSEVSPPRRKALGVEMTFKIAVFQTIRSAFTICNLKSAI
jgi:hypothetical protein